MKRVWKQAAAILMAITILRTCLPASAAGDYVQLIEEVSSQAYLQPVSQITVQNSSGAAPSSVDYTVNDYKSFLETITRRYIARDQKFTIKYITNQSGIIKEILDKKKLLWAEVYAVDIPETVSDLDYLRNNVTSKYHCWHTSSTAVFEFTQTYLTTAAEEKYVNTTVNSILASLDIDNASTYTKIKAIHDYIIKHVDYDTTYKRYSAYDALYARSAVCQGYALLMYKMLMEAGVPVRFISGEADNGQTRGAHAWNIAKIGKYWYNIDITWNDTCGSTKYLLKSNAGFSDHYRDSAFATAAFNTAHPMSPHDFDVSQDVKPVSRISLSHSEGAVYSVGDAFLLSAVVNPVDATDKSLSWSTSNPGVAAVDSVGRVTVIGPGTAVITASANDGTGKSAGYTLTASLPDIPNAWAADYVKALNARGIIPANLNARYRDVITRAEFMVLITNVYKYAKGFDHPPVSAPFIDISISPYKDQIALCAQLGIVEGHGNLFMPENTLTREQCAKVISNAVIAINGGSVSSMAALPYADAAFISGWAVPYVCYAYETGLMEGGNGSFDPQGVLSREQAMTVIERMIEKYGW